MTRQLTSANNPLLIAELPVGDGAIGVTFEPGKQQAGLTGHHRRDLGADLDRIAAWNAAAVVTLVEADELATLGIAKLGAEVRRRHMEWHHLPIRDYGVPGAAFETAWPAHSARLRALLACGGRVLIHCKGGLGRAGMIAARLLVEAGVPSDAAMASVRAARPSAIETTAQEGWVAAGDSTRLPQPDGSRPAARNRAVGALLGLAVGDAVGAALEFSPKPQFAALDDMVGGGPHNLNTGEWTDDTAMALALGDSLLHEPALDATDLMRRFVDWHERGTYSCTGSCFDIGIATRAALERFRRTGEPLAGCTADHSSGNGALMRLAPVVIRHWRDRTEMLRVAALQTRTTHGSPATLAASASLAEMLAVAIGGASLPEVLATSDARIAGGWRGMPRSEIEGTGYVVRSLQAAVWAVARSTNFRSAILLAANLGEDADTTAAIAGQLAGAVYGASGIPSEWLAALAWRERLEDTAARLFTVSWPEGDPAMPTPALNNWMTRNWTLQERLAALAAFAPALAPTGPAVPDGFQQMAYDYGWVQALPWSEWRATERGGKMLHDAEAVAGADPDDLVHVLTTCIRADRFCDGYLDDAAGTGLLARVAARAGALLKAMGIANKPG